MIEYSTISTLSGGTRIRIAWIRERMPDGWHGWLDKNSWYMSTYEDCDDRKLCHFGRGIIGIHRTAPPYIRTVEMVDLQNADMNSQLLDAASLADQIVFEAMLRRLPIVRNNTEGKLVRRTADVIDSRL